MFPLAGQPRKKKGSAQEFLGLLEVPVAFSYGDFILFQNFKKFESYRYLQQS